MKITTHSFGVTSNGRPVTLYRMENRAGAVVEALNYGCTIRSIRVPDRDGKLVDVALGYDTIGEYEYQDGYLGAVIGRYANRLGGARFALNGKVYQLECNDGENQLHGGRVGFDKHTWDARTLDERLVFTRCSPDGEEHYPGALYVRVGYCWSDDNVLTISYEATSDADTVVNLTNHAYFNLSGGGSVLDEELTVYAGFYLETQPSCLPTGRVLPVANTPFDFRSAKAIGRDIGCADAQLTCVGGYDHNFVLGEPNKPKLAAELYAPKTGITLSCTTTMPGVQLYTANCLTERAGKNGAIYGKNGAVCLETQFFPDSPAHPEFPSAVLKRGGTYNQQTTYAFGVKGLSKQS